MFTTDLVNLYNRNIFKTSLYIYIFQDEKWFAVVEERTVITVALYLSCQVQRVIRILVYRPNLSLRFGFIFYSFEGLAVNYLGTRN